jgi:nucleoside-diphosphate-sugar epimerase
MAISNPIFHLFLDSMTNKILVSGATGLLGSHVLIDLVNTDVDLIALYRDDKAKDDVFTLFTYYGIEDKWDKVVWEKGDVLDVQRLNDLMEDVQQVYHCAALVSFDPSDAVKLHSINVEGTQNMVNAALYCGVKKFLHVSSTATIGQENGGLVCTEETRWNNDEQHTFYAKSKYSSEREVWRAIEEGLDAVIVNPCVIIGPGNPHKSSGTMFSTIGNGLAFYTEGANAFVDVRDVSSSMILLMNSDIISERFLCIGENMKFKDLFTLIANEMDVKAPSIKASRLMTSIGWRLMKVISLFNGRAPKVTSESARASHKTILFSNEKIKEQLDIDFRPISAAVSNAVSYLKATRYQ